MVVAAAAHECSGEELPHRPRSGAVAALCWSGREEIPHHQGKRSPSNSIVGIIKISAVGRMKIAAVNIN